MCRGARYATGAGQGSSRSCGTRGNRLYGRTAAPTRGGDTATQGTDRHAIGAASVAVLSSAQGDSSFAQRSPAAAVLAGRRQSRLIELVDWCRYVVGNEPSFGGGRALRTVRNGRGRAVPHDESGFFSDARHDGARSRRSVRATICPTAWTEAITFRPPAALQVYCEHGVAFVDLPATLIWFDQAGRHMESLGDGASGRGTVAGSLSPSRDQPGAAHE